MDSPQPLSTSTGLLAAQRRILALPKPLKRL